MDPDGEKFGAVILAAGWRPYEPEDGEFAHLGYGELPDVVTNHQFEEIAAAGKIMRPSDGKRPNPWFSSRARDRETTRTLPMPVR